MWPQQWGVYSPLPNDIMWGHVPRSQSPLPPSFSWVCWGGKVWITEPREGFSNGFQVITTTLMYGRIQSESSMFRTNTNDFGVRRETLLCCKQINLCTAIIYWFILLMSSLWKEVYSSLGSLKLALCHYILCQSKIDKIPCQICKNTIYPKTKCQFAWLLLLKKTWLNGNRQIEDKTTYGSSKGHW